VDNIRLKARGKINIGLDVIGKREDGYHEMKMVMQTLTLFDNIVVKKRKDGEINVATNLGYLPTNENNLAYKACKIMKDKYGIKEGLDIEIEKHIPVSAGMAGGSSDAAAILVAMNRLFDLGVSYNRLGKIGLELGADVPYCIMRGTVLAEGIGEVLTKLPSFPKCSVVIAKPGFSVSTKMVFGNLKLDEIKHHPNIDGIVEGIKSSNIDTIGRNMGNVLENVTIKEYPIIAAIKDAMRENGCIGTLMTGSGPTVFGLFDDVKDARRCLNNIRIRHMARETFITDIYNV